MKPSPAQTGYTWVGWEAWDWTRFEESIYKCSMGCMSWSKLPLCRIHWKEYNAYNEIKKRPCREDNAIACNASIQCVVYSAYNSLHKNFAWTVKHSFLILVQF